MSCMWAQDQNRHPRISEREENHQRSTHFSSLQKRGFPRYLDLRGLDHGQEDGKGLARTHEKESLERTDILRVQDHENAGVAGRDQDQDLMAHAHPHETRDLLDQHYIEGEMEALPYLSRT
jgi:hypothetical protein